MKSFLVSVVMMFQFLETGSSAALLRDISEVNSTADRRASLVNGELSRSTSCSKIPAEKIKISEISRSKSYDNFPLSENNQNGCFEKVDFSVFHWGDFLEIEKNFKNYRYMSRPFKHSSFEQIDSLNQHLNVITCLVLRHAKDSSNDNIHTQDATCMNVQISIDDLKLLKSFADRVPNCKWIASESDRNKKTVAQILEISPDFVDTDAGFNEMKFPKLLVQGNISKKRAATHGFVHRMIQEPSTRVEEDSESFDDVVSRFLNAAMKIGEKSSNLVIVANTGTMNCLLRFYDPNMKHLHMLNHLNGFVIKIIPSLGVTAIYSQKRQPVLLTPLELESMSKYFSRR